MMDCRSRMERPTTMLSVSAFVFMILRSIGDGADHVGGRAQRCFRTEDAKDVGRPVQPMQFEPDAEGSKFIIFFFALA
jgi:hypothetical protein